MTNTPVVSVLIPTYNSSPEFLTAALRSLEAQTFKSWSAIVHDDCSETDVRGIVQPFLASGKVRFVRSEKRLGIGGNWNACLEYAESPYIAFLFQDDLWSPDYLEQAVKTLDANMTVGFVSLEHRYACEALPEAAPLYQTVTDFRSSQVHAGFHQGPALLKWWLERELTPNVIGEPSFVVMRRDIVLQMGTFLTDMPQFLDVEYWTRLLLSTDWYFLRGNFGDFRVHGKAASAQNQDAGHGLFDRLRCIELLMKTLTGDDRAVAIAARSNALRKMIGKFFRRVGSGKKVSTQGSGELRRFCLRHPIIIFRALVEYLAKGEK